MPNGFTVVHDLVFELEQHRCESGHFTLQVFDRARAHENPTETFLQLVTIELLARVLQKMTLITKQERIIMANLDQLTAQVAANTDAEQSAIILLNGLHQLLIDAQNDPVAIADIVTKLATSRDALAAAVVANQAP